MVVVIVTKSTVNIISLNCVSTILRISSDNLLWYGSGRTIVSPNPHVYRR